MMKRILIAEYDDEQMIVTVFAMDMGSLGITLYTGSKRSPKLRIPLVEDDSYKGRGNILVVGRILHWREMRRHKWYDRIFPME